MRRHLMTIAALCALTAFTAANGTAPTCFRQPTATASVAALKDGSARGMFSAHRACWDNDTKKRGVPENSLLAIRTCKALGIELAEIDLRQTKDGSLIVFHDEDLLRMTGKAGLVRAFDVTELTKMNLYQGDGSQRTNKKTSQVIPTFAQALEEAGDDIVIAIDAKDDIRTLAAEEAKKLGALHRVVFVLPAGARYTAEARRLSAFGAHIRVAVSANDAPDGTAAIAAIADLDPAAVAISRQDRQFYAEAAAEAHLRKLSIWVSTFGSDQDTAKGWASAFASGAHILQIDHSVNAASWRAKSERCVP